MEANKKYKSHRAGKNAEYSLTAGQFGANEDRTKLEMQDVPKLNNQELLKMATMVIHTGDYEAEIADNGEIIRRNINEGSKQEKEEFTKE